jgi:transcriptional antiterminator NusG
MLYSEQEEQTVNSEETPPVVPESMETSETESTKVESADSSLESKDEGLVEPELVDESELDSTDGETADLSSEPSDEEQVEPEPIDTSELASTEAEATSESQDEEQAEPDQSSAESESVEAEVEIAEEETEPEEVELPEEQPTPQIEPEPSLSDGDAAETDLGSIEEGLLESSEFDEEGRSWFVVHCYSGYENKVRHNLEQRIETMGMKDKIFDIVVPTEEEIEVKEGKRRTVERRVFPGYILVNMVMTEESWYVVRNTPGVTGFVGMGNTPTPLRPEEVSQIIKRMEAEAPRIKVTFKSGERVRIVDGPFNDFRGTVSEIDMERAKVRVMVNFFGRETPVELDFLQVEKT